MDFSCRFTGPFTLSDSLVNFDPCRRGLAKLHSANCSLFVDMSGCGLVVPVWPCMYGFTVE